MVRRLRYLLESPVEAPVQSWLRGGLQALILVNVLAVVLETVGSIQVRFAGLFTWLEIASIGVFTVEYLARLIAAGAEHRFSGLGRIRWVFTPMALVDLMAILPAYLPMILGADLRVLRAVRLFRVFRILKIGRYSNAVQSLGRALTASAAEIAVLVFALLIVLVLASSLVYYAERAAQPDAFSSIPAAAWWGIATVTTVGYGDVAPVTFAGRLAAAIVAVLGIGMFALPAGVLGSAFVRQLSDQPCPHCGRSLSNVG